MYNGHIVPMQYSFMSYLSDSGNPIFLASDSNKIMAVAIAVSSFLLFKNMELKYNKLINMVGTSTFGVLLIHTNSTAMREWLWKDTVDSVGYYGLLTFQIALCFRDCIILIFTAFTFLNIMHIKIIEEPCFGWFDKKYNNKIQI